MRETVDIIIPVWNNLNFTKMCINSITTNTDNPKNKADERSALSKHLTKNEKRNKNSRNR